MTFLRRVAQVARDGWLIIGLSLLLILGIEAFYRAQGAARRVLRGQAEGPAHPYRDSTWFARYLQEDEASHQLQWRPFVYYRRKPFAGSHVNVDSSGLRRSVPAARGEGEVTTVFFFGGSTMWGSFQRDAQTIPSLAALRLAARGGRRIDVTNFGETGYVMSQSLIELLIQLRAGARPDVVVFYDGINDVAAHIQNGRPGWPQNEFNREREFSLGRAVYAWQHDAASEGRAILRIGSLAVGRIQWLDRLRQRGAAFARQPLSEDAIDAHVAAYVGSVRSVEALAAEFGFRAVYVWQPALHSTTKPLTAFERSLTDAIAASPFESALQELHTRLPARLEAEVHRVVPGRFLNLSGLFAGDSSPVFVDLIGHTTEAANRPIVNAIVPVIEQLLREPVVPLRQQRP